MLIGRVIDDEIDDHAQPQLTRLVHELDELAERARSRMHAVVVRNVVPVVFVGRRVEGQQP